MTYNLLHINLLFSHLVHVKVLFVFIHHQLCTKKVVISECIYLYSLFLKAPVIYVQAIVPWMHLYISYLHALGFNAYKGDQHGTFTCINPKELTLTTLL